MKDILKASSSPHIRHIDTTSGIMLDVCIALIPATICGVVISGLYSAAVLAVCIATAVLAEFLWNLAFKKKQTISDLSAVVTGLILGLNLPPRLPLWMAAIGSVVAIIVVKQMFGGLGQNFVNPAIAARIVLMVSFPAAMTKFYEPFTNVVASATPLAELASTGSSLGANPGMRALFFGPYPGCIGETSALLLFVGGVYLVLRRVISPIIPTAFIGTVALFSAFAGINPLYAVLSGGVMLGAIFMATDYVTSPTSPLGKLIFGIGCGFITFIIRQFGSLPEGVSYSIIIMNILVPHINKFTERKPFGKSESEAEKNA